MTLADSGATMLGMKQCAECQEPTTHGKDYCSEHIELQPYVRQLLESGRLKLCRKNPEKVIAYHERQRSVGLGPV